MKTFLLALAAAALMLLWDSLIAPITARIVGIPMAVGVWNTVKKNRNLTSAQYVWGYGVYGFGIGMFLFFTMQDYSRWLLGESSRVWSLSWLIFNLVFSLCIGFSAGVLTRDRAPHKND